MGASQIPSNSSRADAKPPREPSAVPPRLNEDVENEEPCLALSKKLNTEFKKQYTASKNIMNSQIKKQLILKSNRHKRYAKLMETPTNESIQRGQREEFLMPIYEAINRIRVITPAFRMIEMDPRQFILMREASILKDYELLEEIGKGSFGSVFRARQRSTGEVRAVKRISKRKLSFEEKMSLLNEFEILRKLDHPNIIKLYELYDADDSIYVVTELCEGGNLLEYVTEGKKMPEGDMRAVMGQLLGAVRYLHDHSVLHRDIKLENIVLVSKKTPSSEGRIEIKLIDFGVSIDLAQHSETETATPMGTLLYMSPQSINCQLLLSSDVYSCGIVLYIMATRRLPFLYKDEAELMRKIEHGDIIRKYMSSLTLDLKLFLVRLLEKNHKKRLTALVAMENLWLTKAPQRAMLTQTKRFKVAEQILAYDAKNNLISLIEGFLVCRTVNQEERQRLAALFDAFDEDRSGVIEVDEFKKFYYQNSEHYDSNEIEELAAILDKNRSGNIDFNEFITAMYSRRKLFQLESLEIAFDFLDKDSSGGISKVELAGILKGVQHEEIDYLFRELDKNKDNHISKVEFLEYFRHYQ